MRLARLKLADESPYMKSGMCCGKVCREKGRVADTTLYRVREYVYRCRACFRRETRMWP